jgi:hypothetical protein
MLISFGLKAAAQCSIALRGKIYSLRTAPLSALVTKCA